MKNLLLDCTAVHDEQLSMREKSLNLFVFDSVGKSNAQPGLLLMERNEDAFLCVTWLEATTHQAVRLFPLLQMKLIIRFSVRLFVILSLHYRKRHPPIMGVDAKHKEKRKQKKKKCRFFYLFCFLSFSRSCQEQPPNVLHLFVFVFDFHRDLKSHSSRPRIHF